MSEEQRHIRMYTTVGLINKVLLAVNLVAVFAVALRPTWWFIALLGLGVMTQSAFILQHRHLIMEEYIHELEGKSVNKWNKPSELIYKINVVLVWPFLLIAGLVMFLLGLAQI